MSESLGQAMDDAHADRVRANLADFHCQRSILTRADSFIAGSDRKYLQKWLQHVEAMIENCERWLRMHAGAVGRDQPSSDTLPGADRQGKEFQEGN